MKYNMQYKKWGEVGVKLYDTMKRSTTSDTSYHVISILLLSLILIGISCNPTAPRRLKSM